MTETHELNRPVSCLRYAARGVGIRGVTHPVKSPRTASDYRFRRPAPLTLSTARRGCAQTVNWRRIRFIFLIGYNSVGSRRERRIQQNPVEKNRSD